MILKYRIIKICNDAGMFCRVNKLFVMFAQLITKIQSFFVFRKFLKSDIVGKFLAPGLNCKVCLSGCNYRLRWITILNYQVTSIPRYMVVYGLYLLSDTYMCHFHRPVKMAFRTLT